MINSLSGIIKDVKEQAITLDTGFLGFAVQVCQESAFTVGQQATLHIYMHWNAENGPSLFGFTDELEKTVFLLIIDCSGIGPKIGLAALATLGAQRFLEIVQTSDEAALSKVSGIGAKKAEQIIVQLKHKVAKLLAKGIQISGSAQLAHWQNLQQVLESLHYSRPEITAALKYVRESSDDIAQPFDQLMRKALSYLAKKA